MTRWLVLLFAPFAFACSNTSSDASACPEIDASACQEPSPSYASDIVPLFNESCNATCHSANAGPWPLTNYQDVVDWQTLVASDMEHCLMPIPIEHGGVALTEKQRAMVLDWIACGARDN